MDEKTGLLELAIRLPSCKHIVGSGCIAQWLLSNNTCPMCRHVFFPAQSRPYLEHGIMESQTRHATNQDGASRSQTLNGPIDDIMEFWWKMTSLCEGYCAQLDLPDIGHVADYLVYNLLISRDTNAILQNDSDHHIVAVGIYLASYFKGQPRSPREISEVIPDVDGDHLCAIYHLLADLSSLSDDLGLNQAIDIREPIWPPRGNEMTARERLRL